MVVAAPARAEPPLDQYSSLSLLPPTVEALIDLHVAIIELVLAAAAAAITTAVSKRSNPLPCYVKAQSQVISRGNMQQTHKFGANTD